MEQKGAETHVQPKKKSILSNCLAGGIAGISVDLISHPIDTIKTRIQGTYGNQEKISFKRLYAGISSNMMVSFPSAFSYFMGYESGKRFVRKNTNLNDTFVHVLGGICAEICANTIRTPFEIVKQQMQMQLDGTLASTVRSVYGIRGLRGFYSGYLTLIMREIPFSAIQMPIYERMKAFTKERNNYSDASSFSFFENARNAVTAGGIASFLTTPIDVVKTKMMVSRQKEMETIRFIAMKIYSIDGALGFFKGGAIRVANISFLSVIFFSVYENALKRIDL